MSQRARDDLVDIAHWYTDRHPSGYERFLRDFQLAVETLRTFPGAGRARAELRENLRTYYVHPYIVFYDVSVAARMITVVRVLYGRTDFGIDE